MEMYNLRGNRVAPMLEADIQAKASQVSQIFKLNKRTRKKCEFLLFEQLSQYSITLNIVNDKDWINVTKGHFDPSQLEISVPNRIYVNACKGEREALFVMLHEIGHLFLGHKALLHKSSQPPLQAEDSEWQADIFAEQMLMNMGYETKQMSFDFYI